MRILAWEEGRWAMRHDLPREEAHALALGPVPVWVRAEDVDPSEWDTLGEGFELHPLALEDLRNPRQRPKVEDYPDVTFVVLRIPRYTDDDVRWVQVGVFLGEGFVMTATGEAVPELDEAERRLLAGDRRVASGQLDHVFYHVIDTLVDAWFPFMDAIEDRLEDLEDQVLDHADKHELGMIRDFKDLASRTRKVLSPMREATLSLERADHPNIRPETRIFLRDVADHTIRLAERLEHVREMALIAQETWNATLANQQNETMKRLTVIAALLLVPGLAAGLGGMNFEGMPDWNYWIVTAGILTFIVLGFAVAIWRKWM